jgi:hypothetical protein
VTVKELYDRLGEFINDNPNTINDEIYYCNDGLDVNDIDGISIEWDLNWEGRYIILK